MSISVAFNPPAETERLCLGEYHDALRTLLALQLEHEASDCYTQEVQRLFSYPLWKSCELASAYLAANCLLCDIHLPKLSLKQKEFGAVPLLKRQKLMWGALPYPHLHAELGAILAFLGGKSGEQEYVDIALKMGLWHVQLLDHKKLPLFSPWLQEGAVSYQELLGAYYFLFRQLMDHSQETFGPLAAQMWEMIQHESKEETPFWHLIDLFPLKDSTKKFSVCIKPHTFYDPDFTFAKKQDDESTICIFGSGCKSSLGLFLGDKGGIVSYGPQRMPLGVCQEFGIASSPSHFQQSGLPLDCQLSDDEIKLHFAGRLAKASARKSFLDGINEGGFAGAWIEGTQTIRDHELHISCKFEGTFSLGEYYFVFFAKAEAALVAGSHKLNPRSLDRYKGPADTILFDVGKSSLVLKGSNVGGMEVIPLAGGDDFWAADFLVAYSLNSECVHLWKIETQNSG